MKYYVVYGKPFAIITALNMQSITQFSFSIVSVIALKLFIAMSLWDDKDFQILYKHHLHRRLENLADEITLNRENSKKLKHSLCFILTTKDL